jgi:hypothetical protein
MSSGGLAVRWLHVLAMALFKDAITGGRERDEEPASVRHRRIRPR